MELERCGFCYEEKTYLLDMLEQHDTDADGNGGYKQHDYICLECVRKTI